MSNALKGLIIVVTSPIWVPLGLVLFVWLVVYDGLDKIGESWGRW